MEAADLRSHVESALRCISSPSPPDAIRQAQEALLRWEEAHADAYVASLVSLTSVASASADREERTSAATLRLSAVLALKAAVSRRWKDRGRGRAGEPKALLSEEVKAAVRRAALNLVLSGDPSRGDGCGFVADANRVSAQQLELIEDRALQTNAASLLSKIARMDLPLKFHEAIPTLVEGVQRAQGMKVQQPSLETQQFFRTVLCNITNALEMILSEISTQRLLVDKKYRNSVALQHLGSIVQIGLFPSLRDLDALMIASNEIGEGHIISMLQLATLSSKVVAHMMNSSFSKLVEGAATKPLVDETLSLIHSFLSQWLPSILGGNVTGETMRNGTEELVQVHCDLILDLQRSHPLPFVGYLTPYMKLFHSSLMHLIGISPDGTHGAASVKVGTISLCTNRFAIAFLSFVANVVGTPKYSELDAVKMELSAFWTPALTLSLANTLVQLFSIYIWPTGGDDSTGDTDTVLWQDDPEGFYQWEMARSSEDDAGCAAQNLFLALLESPFSSEVALPWFAELLTRVSSQRLAAQIEAGVPEGVNGQDISRALPLGVPPPRLSHGDDVAIDLVLQWDAIYTAAGLAGSMLESQPAFDYQPWFDDFLGPCLELLFRRAGKESHLPILLRRITWLISCNPHRVKISSPFNPLGTVASALSSHDDVCVRLTAVQALDSLLPYCEDTPQLLHAIVDSAVPAIYQLTNQCAEVESRSACLELLSNLVTYVGMTGGSLSHDLLNVIVAPLSSIWDNAVNENLLLKRNVLTILSCVASYVGPESCKVLYPLALPLVDDSLARDENVFLVQEALKIWWLFLRLSRQYDPLMGKLFLRAAELSRDLEHVMILMRITEHYIYLGGASFLNERATTVQTVMSNVVGEVRPRGTAYIFLVFEALLRAFPVEGGSLLQSCGVLPKLLLACASSYVDDDNCEPDRVIVLYLAALARVALAHPSSVQVWLPVKLASGTVFGEDELVSLYLMKFGVAGNGAHGMLFQKLWAMLLLSFYPPCQLQSCQNAVLRRSNAVFSKLVFVLKNEHVDGSNILSYEIGYDEDEETVDVGTEINEALLQEQRAKDAIIWTPLRKTLAAKMATLPGELEQKYKEFISTIDCDTLLELEGLL
ncbi:hypothetical protein ACHAWF_010132 [Thalassiosira exigua]